MEKLGGIAIGITALALLAGCASAPAEPEATALEAAVAGCKLERLKSVSIGDGGYSLIVNGYGKENTAGLPYEGISCLLDELEVPDSTLAKIDNTRAMDGQQTADWGDITATWSYHPDSGPRFIFELAEPTD